MQSNASGIAELTSHYGISHRTVRFYEDLGLLAPRRIGTARLYSAQDKIRLELVLKGKHLGFSLAEIKRLIQSQDQPGSGCDERSSPSMAERLDRDTIRKQLDALLRRQRDIQVAIDELNAALAPNK